MLSAAIGLLLNGIYMMLRLSENSGSFPRPLSAQQERACIELCLQGDLQARNTLIEHNLRLVAHIIKKYYTSSADQDDLISIGTIGLIKGISTFKAEKGTRLATYAARCIENEILMFFRSQKRLGSELSLSDPIDTDKDGNTLALMDVICADDGMFDRIDSGDDQKLLYRFVEECLDQRERRVICLRYGLGGIRPCTQREIAQMCGISRSYVSRIEKRALKKLEERFTRGGAEPCRLSV